MTSTIRSIYQEVSDLDQVVLQGEQRGSRASVQADFPVNVDHMGVDGRSRHVQLTRDLLVGAASGEHAQDVHFAVSEPGRPVARRSPPGPEVSSALEHRI